MKITPSPTDGAMDAAESSALALQAPSATDDDVARIDLERGLTHAVWALRDVAYDRLALEAFAIAILKDAGVAGRGAWAGADAPLAADPLHQALARFLRPLLHSAAEPARDMDAVHKAERLLEDRRALGRRLETIDPCATVLEVPPARSLYRNLPAIPAVSWIAEPRHPPAVVALWSGQMARRLADGTWFTPAPGAALLRFLDRSLRTDAEALPAALLQPFRELARLGLLDCVAGKPGLPTLDGIGISLERGLVPFHCFRQWVATCAAELSLAPSGAAGVADGVVDPASPRAYWEITLGALFSPLARNLLGRGPGMLEALCAWVGIDARTRGVHAPGDAFVDGPLPGCATRVAHLLASIREDELPSRPDAIEAPDVIPYLAYGYVPLGGIACMLSAAGTVEWHAMEEVMESMTILYRTTIMALESPASSDAALAEQRFAFYFGPEPRLRAQWESIQELGRLHAEHLLLAQRYFEAVKHHPRLTSWTMAVSRRSNGDPFLDWRAVPAAALYASWRTRLIDIDDRVWIARLMMQGFDEAAARDLVSWGMDRDSPAPLARLDGMVDYDAALPAKERYERLSAWSGHGAIEDLAGLLDDGMKAAVGRWLRDPRVSGATLALVPAMIRTGLGPAQIDDLLYGDPPLSADVLADIFNADAGVPRLVYHGLMSLDELWRKLADQRCLPFSTEASPAVPASAGISAPRAAIASVLAGLRSALHALETVRSLTAPGSEHAHRCEALRQAWQDAATRLEGMLAHTLEDDIGRDPRGFENAFLHLREQLGRSMRALTGGPGAYGAYGPYGPYGPHVGDGVFRV
ncbi:hypothetical protein BOSP111201_25685 [Bordetella sputigena]|uniref:hypothetical protein n=1 Tax=Bordetella sputigena TaxID=1416810 RepID=UPI0039EFAC9C